MGSSGLSILPQIEHFHGNNRFEMKIVVVKARDMKAVDRVPSRITMLEGSMDWLIITPILIKSGVLYFMMTIAAEDVSNGTIAS